jgi:hypothetical protein
VFSVGPPRGYITRISGSLEIELRESLETAVEDDEKRRIVCHIVICEV